MLKDNLSKRFTAKWWDSQEIDENSLNYILECAFLSPSKQGRYNYKIYVLTSNQQSTEFKQWLYWENTYCLDKIRGKKGEGLKRFNGQVLAPIVLLWIANDHGHETRDDCLVSASIAMCAALEKNLHTGFNGCLGGDEIASKLSIPGTAIISLGVGHATPDYLKNRNVFLKDQQVGFDLSNTDPTITDNYNRVNKPKFSELFIFL